MTSKLITRRLDGVTIVNVTGELTLRNEILQAMAAGSTQILLNMAGMNRIDSFALGELVGAYTFFVNAGGRMKLLKVQPRVKHVLDITRLCAVFEMYEDETSAVQSFADAQLPRPVPERASLGSEVFFG